MTTPSFAPVAGSLSPAPDAKIAMGWMHTAKFLTTAAQLHHLPPIHVPEIAFVGRSNAGKSTCINTLTQQKQLAFASKRPGRTQHINLFSLGKHGVTDAVLADLPGYGYAKVSRSDKVRWQQVMVNYLVSRPGLTGIVLLCDPRLGLTELDEKMAMPWAGTPPTLVKSPATARTSASPSSPRTPQNRSKAGIQVVSRVPSTSELDVRRMVASPSHSSWNPLK